MTSLPHLAQLHPPMDWPWLYTYSTLKNAPKNTKMGQVGCNSSSILHFYHYQSQTLVPIWSSAPTTINNTSPLHTFPTHSQLSPYYYATRDPFLVYILHIQTPSPSQIHTYPSLIALTHSTHIPLNMPNIGWTFFHPPQTIIKINK